MKGGISFDEDALSKTPGGKAQRRRTPSRDRIVDSSGGEPETTPDGALTDASLEQMVIDIQVCALSFSRRPAGFFNGVGYPCADCLF